VLHHLVRGAGQNDLTALHHRERIREIAGELLKMGFGRIIRPEGTSVGSPNTDGGAERRASVVEVSTLEEAVAVALL
jgi:hypothetical protein